MEIDPYQMSINQFLLYLRNKSSASNFMIKKRKLMVETKKRYLTDIYQKEEQVYIGKANDPVKLECAHDRPNAHTNQVNMDEDMSAVMKRAKTIQANLPPEFPSFIKTMVYSHVTHGFYMRLSGNFCYLHMPKEDTTLHLVDENEEEFKVKVLVRNLGHILSGGWRAFSIIHKLLEGDVLIFQLINPSKLKVYIVRANDPVKTETDLVLSNITARANRVKFFDDAEEKIARHCQSDVLEQNSPMVPTTDQEREVINSKTSAFLLDFKKVKSIENFTIFVNGSILNSELSDYHKTKYYDLCRVRNSFLHAHLHRDIKGKVAADMISETVNIADNISVCKVSTPQSEYLKSIKILEGYKMLGMDVGFLHAKLTSLFNLAFESKEGVDSMRYREVSIQLSCARDEIRTLELKILELKLLEMKVWELKHVMKKLDVEMETLRSHADKHEIMFQEEVNAPWF